jgi:hypothetical protein
MQVDETQHQGFKDYLGVLNAQFKFAKQLKNWFEFFPSTSNVEIDSWIFRNLGFQNINLRLKYLQKPYIPVL